MIATTGWKLGLVILAIGLAGWALAATGPAPAPQGDPIDSGNEVRAVPLIEMKNASMPFPGVMSAGQPTEEELRAVATAGYTTVINMRTLAEEGAWDETELVESLGMRFIHFPVAGGQDLTEENVRRFSELIDSLGEEPVLVHCASANRVGAFFALEAAWIEGATAEQALDIGRKAGMTSAEPLVRQKLGVE